MIVQLLGTLFLLLLRHLVLDLEPLADELVVLPHPVHVGLGLLDGLGHGPLAAAELTSEVLLEFAKLKIGKS